MPKREGRRRKEEKRKEEKIDLIVSINYPLAGLGGRGSVYVGLVATTRQREYSIS
jgi:hypothetical protein